MKTNKNKKQQIIKNISDDVFLGFVLFISLIGVLETMITHILPTVFYAILVFAGLLGLIIKKQM
jgi:hypothetical protein